jgi:phage terminase large subunit-like protein
MTRGERMIAFIERYCIVPEGTLVGERMVLDAFQRRFILEVYDNPDGTNLGILSMAKKNGKTGLVSAIVLGHVAGPEAVANSQIVCGAMSRDQAGILFDYASKMVNLSPDLSRVVRIVPSRKRMYGLARNVEFRVLSADAKRTQGISPIIAILDEVGQIRGPRSEFVDAITTAQGAYDEAMLFLISTQAPNDADYLSIEIDDARAGDNPHTVCHVYEAPKDCQVDDAEAWRAANPALGNFRSLADLQKLAEKARRMPSFGPTFRNLNLNQRVETSSPFVARDVWNENAGDLLPHDGIAPVWCGLDLSSHADLTAFVMLWQVGDVWNIAPTFWTPAEGLRDRAKRDRQPYDVWAEQGFIMTTPGATVDYDVVAEHLLEMTEGMNLQQIAFDRWRIDSFRASLVRKEAPAAFIEKMTPFGQGFQSMSPALDALEGVLLNKRGRHANHPVLRMCAANAKVTKDPAGNRKLDKMKSTGRIDGLVALAQAAGIAADNMRPKTEPKYEVFVLGGKAA